MPNPHCFEVGEKMLKSFLVALIAARAFAADVQVSGPIRVFKGKTGERITLVEINGSREVVAQFRQTGGDLNGKTIRLSLDDQGHGKKDAFILKGKRRKKFVIIAQRGEFLDFTDPSRPVQALSLKFSDKDTKGLDAAKFLQDNQPTVYP